MSSEIVLGIDPAIGAPTGLAWVSDRDGIHHHASIPGRARVKAADGFDHLQRLAVARAQEIVFAAQEAIHFDAVAIEGWEYQGPQRAATLEAYTTPVLLGALAALLVDTGWTVAWQSAGQVLGRRGYGWLMRMDPARVGIRRWSNLRNEHERSAACHGLWLARARQQAHLTLV